MGEWGRGRGGGGAAATCCLFGADPSYSSPASVPRSQLNCCRSQCLSCGCARGGSSAVEEEVGEEVVVVKAVVVVVVHAEIPAVLAPSGAFGSGYVSALTRSAAALQTFHQLL